MKLIKYISLAILLIPIGAQVQSQNCTPNVTVSTPSVSGTNTTYQASNSVIGTSTVHSGDTVIFDAGLEVVLSPNFDVLPGGVFDATIGGCSGSLTLPNDPYFPYQWGHHNTGNVPTFAAGVPVSQRVLGGSVDADTDLPEAWGVTQGSSSITVAILDYGFDMGHPDLDASRVRDGYDFVHGTSNYNDTTGHGTNVAGILGATPNNGIGTAGVDWNCMIMPLKISDGNDFGGFQRIIAAVDHAILKQANIISMSFGGASEQSKEVEDVFRDAIDAGILLFAASGNDNRDSVDYPARYPSIVGVGAMSPCNERKSSVTNSMTGSCDRDDRNDGNQIAHWGSNYGDGLDFLAPGTLLPTTDVRGSLGISGFPLIYQSDSSGNFVFDSWGTSMASPFAAGIASLVWSINPALKNYQVRHILQQSSVPASGIGTGHGSLNAHAAVVMAQSFNPNVDYLLPNLVFEIISAPTSVVSNGTLSINYRVKNIGDATANNSVLAYNIDLVNVASTISIPALAAGQAYTGQLNIPITSFCTGIVYYLGDYSMEFLVDGQSEVEEYNEFNTYGYNFEVLEEPGAPDLIIENVGVQPGKSGGLQVDFDVKNIGDLIAIPVNFPAPNAPTFAYKFYLSSDNQLDQNDTQILFVRDYGFALCPQLSNTITEALSGQGNYLIIEIDAEGRITESNENNNIAVISLLQKWGNKSASVFEIGSNSYKTMLVPNPISESGSVQFVLESQSEVSIAIYDLMGTEVRNVILNQVFLGGMHEVAFEKEGLASGVYFVEVIVNEEKSLLKLLVN